MDRQDEANSCFCHFVNGTKNETTVCVCVWGDLTAVEEI